ncbi:unnamed protein product [Chironomus riparius]|uniref:Uncharacterized protein n=1 Tax=Chironomus riparius TaxID=315576 RepID=A0A9N9SBA8_9DIPT|nr:unnamed protein product [Chironomus riparius]
MSETQRTACLEWTLVEKKPPKNVIVNSPSIFKQNQQKSLLEIEAERNYNDQKKIDNEVIVSGLKAEPKKDFWLELINIAGISDEKIENHGNFKGQNGKFFITIGFKDKISQTSFTKEINSKQSLIKNKARQFFVHNRLTKFNSSVEKELQELTKSGAIHGHKREGYLFQAKFTGHSSWTLINTQHALKKFTKEATQTKKIDDRVERRENVQKQQELDRQVRVHGLTSKPQKVDDVVTKFMQRFDLSFDDVVSYTIKNIDSRWTIFIKLSDNLALRKILTSKTKKIRLSYLTGSTAEHLIDAKVTWKRALTEFNHKVNKQLQEAYKKKIIHQFEFADHRFRVKVDQSSFWVPIECIYDLYEILKTKK